MALTATEKRKNRLKTHKQYTIYIDLDIAIPFEKKIKKEKSNVTEWIQKNMKKYIENT